MPTTETAQGSEYNQSSFRGGMNLLDDDSRLQPNQYRAGFNLTNRNDVLELVGSSELDAFAPAGLKQELVTFGNYLVLFVSGYAYYRYYTDTGWRQISDFRMSTTAPRYWTVAVPVSITNYIRIAATGTINTGTANPSGSIELSSVLGASAGNLPGLLVQDNVSQPQFIFLDNNGIPATRVTKSFDQWYIQFTDAANTQVASNGDQREYVPIGNVMAWVDGILYIASQNRELILRSVSGRPLDFVVNVTNLLATVAPFKQFGGGNAYTTAYSVGVGGITCLRQLGEGLFVSASGANFLVTKNKTPGAVTEFGEYTFNRTFLFNATCLSDRVIFDSLGDTRFVDLTGVRSFNAILQIQNEGKNSVFSSLIQKVFGPPDNQIIQSAEASAAILYDNYELYAMNTIFGSSICKYDTLNGCWTSFDVGQAAGKSIKILAKIELSVQRLYAITTDNQLYTLYIGDPAPATFRTIGVCANILYANSNIRMANPKNEIKLQKTRVVVNEIVEDCTCSFVPYINNRKSKTEPIVKAITYESPANPDADPLSLPDVNTQLMNMLYSTPNCEQGWKVFGVFTWNGGVFTQFSMEMTDLTPMNPARSQNLS